MQQGDKRGTELAEIDWIKRIKPEQCGHDWCNPGGHTVATSWNESWVVLEVERGARYSQLVLRVPRDGVALVESGDQLSPVVRSCFLPAPASRRGLD